MADGYRILVVEDDAAVRRLVTTTLDLHGYAYREARTASQALLELSSQPPDLAILDLGLPDGDGVEVIRTLRGWSSLPVIVLSARLEDADKVEALDAGADDYLVKPFSVEELLARVRVALRRLDRERAMKGDADEAVYRNGSLRIDYAAGSVWRDDEEIHLTPFEYKLLPRRGRVSHDARGIGALRAYDPPPSLSLLLLLLLLLSVDRRIGF